MTGSLKLGCSTFSPLLGVVLLTCMPSAREWKDAWRLFNKMPFCDVVSWTIHAWLCDMKMWEESKWHWNFIITWFANGEGATEQKFCDFVEGPEFHVEYVGVVAVEEGRQAHEQIIQNSCECDIFMEKPSLIENYRQARRRGYYMLLENVSRKLCSLNNVTFQVAVNFKSICN